MQKEHDLNLILSPNYDSVMEWHCDVVIGSASQIDDRGNLGSVRMIDCGLDLPDFVDFVVWKAVLSLVYDERLALASVVR